MASGPDLRKTQRHLPTAASLLNRPDIGDGRPDTFALLKTATTLRREVPAQALIACTAESGRRRREWFVSGIGHRRSHARRESGPGYHERRLRLLSGAAEVFKEKGFQAASVNDIAARFGGDRASVYYYYGSKHEIFIDLIQSAVTEVVEAAEEVAGSGESAAARLERLLATTMDLYEQHYPYMYVYIQEDMRKVPGDGTPAGKELKRLSDRFESALHRIVDDGFTEGAFREGLDPAMLIFALAGAVNWTHRWFSPGGRLTGHEVGAAMAEIFLSGVRAGPRTRRPAKAAPGGQANAATGKKGKPRKTGS
ncbi:TetR/AcrR family transcriptional regulator [Amycolatopsis sp. NPDC005232]|uniref:TetR/AcrR family transcriptional regulator n=1 Tax=Amycolatopsis sp. NPDC005232 TaxID=3157027 RepID=UPI0033A7B0F2